jgi:hypothetical protein
MDLETLAIKVAAAVANHALPGSGGPMEALLGEMLSVQDAQLAALRRIDANVQALVDGPWKTGHRHLEEASLPGRTTRQVRSSLKQAQALFRQAADLQPSGSLTRASVCLDLAMVCGLVGDRQLSELYAQEGSREAFAAVAPYFEAENPTRRRLKKVGGQVGTGAIVGAMIVFAPILYVVMPVAERVNDSRDRAQAARVAEVAQFRAIRRAAEVLGAPVETQPLALPMWERS